MTAPIVDEVVVSRLISGRKVEAATKAERREAVTRLLATEMTHKAIAERVGVTTRTVERIGIATGQRRSTCRPPGVTRGIVFDVLHANPELSQRQVALAVGITKSSAWRIIRDLVADGCLPPHRDTRGPRPRRRVTF